MDRFPHPEDGFLVFYANQSSCSLLFQVFLEMGRRGLGVFGGLNPTLQSMPTSCHSFLCLCFTVLCLSAGTTRRMFFQCWPISPCPPSPAISCSFSWRVNINNPCLLPTVLDWFNSHPVSIFETYKLALLYSGNRMLCETLDCSLQNHQRVGFSMHQLLINESSKGLTLDCCLEGCKQVGFSHSNFPSWP